MDHSTAAFGHDAALTNPHLHMPERERAPYFKTGDVVRYRGALCKVVAVLDRARPGDARPWYFYDLKEELGDGEYNDVDESSILRQRDPTTKNKKKAPVGLQRFFHFVDAHNDDIWINVFRIDYLIGKEVTMDTGKVFALTRAEADALTALIGCVNPGPAEVPA